MMTLRATSTRWGRSPVHLALLGLLAGFTLFAIGGYAVFGRNPQLLRAHPELLAFYGVSFEFFAIAHVLLGAAVLVTYLVYRSRWSWLPAFGVVYAISLSSELSGTSIGLPFGAYRYTELLGPKWFGLVPLLIPLSWFLMAVPAYRLALHRFPFREARVKRLTLATLLLATWDLSLDPAMSYLTPYWIWGEEGVYYGMPLLNLFGWIAVGAILMIALESLRASRWMKLLSLRWSAAYFGITLFMPFGMVIAGGLWGAVLATGAALGFAMLVLHRADRADISGEAESMPPAWSSDGIPDRRVEPVAQDTRVFFRHHSRSFSFAACWFSRDQRRLIECLYAFCRTVDDLVDRSPSLPQEQIERALQGWIDRAERAYGGHPTGIQWLDEIMDASARAGVPIELVRELVRGCRMDCGPVAIQSLKDLDLYTYRVASVIGLWLCHLHGVRDPSVLDRAAALGRAMQLTNILRDVGEDLKQNRIYLPADLMAVHGVTSADLKAMLGGEPITEGYRHLMLDLMERAEREYAYAFPGLRSLPLPFARASAVAAEIYRGIHDSLTRNRFDNFHRRAHTSILQRIILAIRGNVRLTLLRARGQIVLPALSGSRRLFDPFRCAFAPIGLSAFLAISVSGATPPPSSLGTTMPVMKEPPPLEEVRERYLQAVEDRSVIDPTVELIDASETPDPVLRAYSAALTVLHAKHVFWPNRKMHYLRIGLPELDELVQAHPRNVEIRYLRLLSCYYLPGFLGRKDTVREDLSELARLLPESESQFPPHLFREMVRFVEQNGDAESRERLESLTLEEEATTSDPTM